jgi:hypothetical protein
MQQPDDNPGDHRPRIPVSIDGMPMMFWILLAFRIAASVVGRMPFAVSQKLTAGS